MFHTDFDGATLGNSLRDSQVECLMRGAYLHMVDIVEQI